MFWSISNFPVRQKCDEVHDARAGTMLGRMRVGRDTPGHGWSSNLARHAATFQRHRPAPSVALGDLFQHAKRVASSASHCNQL